MLETDFDLDSVRITDEEIERERKRLVIRRRRMAEETEEEREEREKIMDEEVEEEIEREIVREELGIE